MTVTVLISALGVFSSALFAFLGYQRGKAAQNRGEGETKGIMMSDIGYIKAGVDDLKREQKEANNRIAELSERLSRCEESCKQAHKRLDSLDLV